MQLSTYQIFIALGIFLLVTILLIKTNYKGYQKKFGIKSKLDGFNTGYVRVMVLLGFAITVILMFILKNTILI